MKLTPEEAKQIIEDNYGDLDLSGRKDITELPDNLSVWGHTRLTGTNITSLPDNFTSEGGLDIHSTNITSLPDSLTVGSILNLRNTKIRRIPAEGVVNGDILIN